MKKNIYFLAKTICIFVVLFVVFNILFFFCTNQDISVRSPEEVFKEYVCEPIPKGVNNIQSKGNISLASTSILIKFNVTDEAVVKNVIKKGEFKIRRDLDETGSFNKLNDQTLIYDKEYRGYQNVELKYNARSLSCEAYYGGG